MGISWLSFLAPIVTRRQNPILGTYRILSATTNPTYNTNHIIIGGFLGGLLAKQAMSALCSSSKFRTVKVVLFRSFQRNPCVFFKHP